MIKRRIAEKFRQLMEVFPVVALTGPRQSGKTTLAQGLFSNGYRYVSLEDLDMRDWASRDPRGFLSDYDSRVVIDEAQLVPSLFSYIQGVVDKKQIPGQYILTGSQHFLLHEKIAQSLSGRAAFLHLLPLSIEELKLAGIPLPPLEEALFRGFYPRLFSSQVEVGDWYSNYIRTYVERDLRQMKNIQDLGTFQLFLKMCAARTGQLLDLTSIGNDCGISHNTVRNWLNLLEASFIVFFLRPYARNYGKRLMKSPKLYFYDTGLLAHLLDIESPQQLAAHYLRGGIFESYVVSEMKKNLLNRGKEPHLYFWRDKQGREIDCLWERGGVAASIEIKSSKTIATDFFDHLKSWQELSGSDPKGSYLVYGGGERQKRSEATVLPWSEVLSITEAEVGA